MKLNYQFRPLYLIVYVVCKGWSVDRGCDKEEGGGRRLVTLNQESIGTVVISWVRGMAG